MTFMKMKFIRFYLRKTINGLCSKQNNSDFFFSSPHHFVKMSKFVAGHVTSLIFKLMNYLFLKTNLALKFQGKC